MRYLVAAVIVSLVVARIAYYVRAGFGKVPENAKHEQVFCSFCGKSQHEVRSLIEGGCRNPALSQCVFICDECVSFSAQIIADTKVSARSP